MHDLNQYKDKLLCCFCRNPLTHVDITIKDYKGDFVSVWCPGCKNLEKQWGPKFLICCCGSEPKELDIEMAKSEIEQAENTSKFVKKAMLECHGEDSECKSITDLNIENDRRILESMNVPVPDSMKNNNKGSDKTEVSTLSKKRRRSNTTGF